MFEKIHFSQQKIVFHDFFQIYIAAYLNQLITSKGSPRRSAKQVSCRASMYVVFLFQIFERYFGRKKLKDLSRALQWMLLFGETCFKKKTLVWAFPKAMLKGIYQYCKYVGEHDIKLTPLTLSCQIAARKLRRIYSYERLSSCLFALGGTYQI